MAAGSHFGCPKSLCIAFLTISDQYHNLNFCEFFLQNGCWRPFWMSENHFRLHFWPFQINTQLFLFIFYKMAAVGHFGCAKFTLDHISGYFWSIQIFLFFLQNGWRRPFWMSEFHFRSHFWPFQIDTQLIFFVEIFDKMADVVHFGCPKFTFNRISGHFRSICNFNFFWKFLTKWMPAAILDARNSLSIAFLAISDRSAILDFRNLLSIAILAISDGYGFFSRRPFWMSEIHFGSHFWPFQIDRPFWMSEIHFRWHLWPFQIHTELNFFGQISAGGHFGWDDNVNYRTHPRYLDVHVSSWKNVV